MSERVQGLEAWLAAYDTRDRDAMGAALADDAVWHVGGAHRLSGDYRGRDAILDYFETVWMETADTMKLAPLEVMANDRHGAAFLHVTAERHGQPLDVVLAEEFRFDEDGRILEFWAHANDQAAIDRFWA